MEARARGTTAADARHVDVDDAMLVSGFHRRFSLYLLRTKLSGFRR